MNHSVREDCAGAMFEALDGYHDVDVASCLDDATLLHVSGASGLAGDYQGQEVILELLDRLSTLTGGTLRCGPWTPATSTTARATTAVRGPLVAERHGRRLATTVEVAVDVEGDVVREVWIADLGAPAFDDFWA